MFVYVISKDGQPLMPTSRFGKVRRLLKSKQAKVIKRCPFTIQLLYEPETKIVQNLDCGQDTGSKYCGTAVYSNSRIYYQSQLELRDDIKRKMDDRRGYRRSRRNRKCRYRKARWLNRRSSIKRGRIPPSIESKISAQEREIEFVMSIIPINRVIIEVGQFDPHLMKNPALANEKVKHWGYQKGQLYGFDNMRAYVLSRDNYTCQCCKTKKGSLHIHHIVYRSNGGSDTSENLVVLCEKCHSKLHAGELKEFEAKLVGKKKGLLSHATQMNIVRSQLLQRHSDYIETYGYITKHNRQNLGLSKSHCVDACVIASQGQPFELNACTFYKKCVGNGTRVLSKFRKVPIAQTQGKINGFNRYDKVLVKNKEYFVYARSTTGNFIIEDIFGNRPDFGIKTLGSIACKWLKLVNIRRSVICVQT